MGWQTLAAYGVAGLAVVGIVYIAFRMLWRKGQESGEDKEARETLEKIVDKDRKMHEMAGRAIPMSRDEQLRRLKRLRDKIHRRQR